MNCVACGRAYLTGVGHFCPKGGYKPARVRAGVNGQGSIEGGGGDSPAENRQQDTSGPTRKPSDLDSPISRNEVADAMEEELFDKGMQRSGRVQYECTTCPRKTTRPGECDRCYVARKL